MKMSVVVLGNNTELTFIRYNAFTHSKIMEVRFASNLVWLCNPTGVISEGQRGNQKIIGKF